MLTMSNNKRTKLILEMAIKRYKQNSDNPTESQASPSNLTSSTPMEIEFKDLEIFDNTKAIELNNLEIINNSSAITHNNKNEVNMQEIEDNDCYDKEQATSTIESINEYEINIIAENDSVPQYQELLDLSTGEIVNNIIQETDLVQMQYLDEFNIHDVNNKTECSNEISGDCVVLNINSENIIAKDVTISIDSEHCDVGKAKDSENVIAKDVTISKDSEHCDVGKAKDNEKDPDWVNDSEISDEESNHTDGEQDEADANHEIINENNLTENEDSTIVGETGKRRLKSQNKAEINKNKKARGDKYTSKTGRSIEEKVMKSNPCAHGKCQNGCCDNFTEQDRQTIFDNYWKLNNNEKRHFLLNYQEEVPKKRTYSQKAVSRRARSMAYYFPKDNNRVKICQQFFLKTLDISQRILQYTFEKRSDLNTPKQDMRGRKEPPNKTPIDTKKIIIDFIKLLPAVPSHYCRSGTQKKYLPTEFRNLTNVYRLYKEYCMEKNVKCVKEKVFRDVFNKDFNIGIHNPKKDKCAHCTNFEGLNDPSEEQKAANNRHIIEKQASMDKFKKDQERSKMDKTFGCVSFDLQKVLQTPHGDNMLLYYSRKYAVYNLTFYESNTRSGYCYLWTESEGKRGANEICSILYDYLRKVDVTSTVSEIALYCDNCPGQNKNRQVLTTIFLFLKSANNLKTISINYLLAGHTYMPVDSMHACIESAYRKKIIWAPSEWPTIITNCRKSPKPYNVEVLTHTFFRNWKEVTESVLPSNIKTSLGQKIVLRNIRRVVMNKDDDYFSINYTFTENNADETIKLRQVRSRLNHLLEPKHVYTEKLSITTAKYNDLLIPYAAKELYLQDTTLNINLCQGKLIFLIH